MSRVTLSRAINIPAATTECLQNILRLCGRACIENRWLSPQGNTDNELERRERAAHTTYFLPGFDVVFSANTELPCVASEGHSLSYGKWLPEHRHSSACLAAGPSVERHIGSGISCRLAACAQTTEPLLPSFSIHLVSSATMPCRALEAISARDCTMPAANWLVFSIIKVSLP
jgi:hypothetical protein